MPFDVVQAVRRIGQGREHPPLFVVVLTEDLAFAEVEPVADTEPVDTHDS